MIGEKSASGRLAWKATLLSLVVVVVLSIIQILIIYPRFIHQTTEAVRNDAVRDARHISHMIPYGLSYKGLRITGGLEEEIAAMMSDFTLLKLSLFAPDGTIVYSTDRAEIGEINRKPFFIENVARGEVVSKTVWRKQITMEGVAAQRDVVETYVPIMSGETFLGACEVYHDITESKSGFDRLIRHASMLTLGIGGMLLVIIALVSAKAERALRKQMELQDQLVLSDRLAAIGTLAGGMAHEFNNINSTVLGFSQLVLDRQDLSPAVREHLGRIKRAARRARSITASLLDFARQPKKPRQRGTMALAAREALILVKDIYEKEGIAIEDDIGPVPESRMDIDQLVQVILNVLDNARHAVMDSPRKIITILTRGDGQLVYCRISDTGCGIGEEKLSQIFTPFFTMKGEYAVGLGQSKVRGTGLGLSLCHAIVANHDGNIEVKSTEGRGTAVIISIPATDGNAVESINSEGDGEGRD